MNNKMAKITIDEVEYDTEKFNEKQLQAYEEINFVNDMKRRHEYEAALLNGRIVVLSKFIVDNNG